MAGRRSRADAKAPAPPLLRLSRNDLELDLAPQWGGAIAGFRWRGQAIMRPTSAETLAAGPVTDLASFPMAPFCGRIAHGRFRFGGHDVRLSPNMGDHPHALHGQAWRAPWRVTQASTDRASLAYDYPAGEWPWAYSAEQTFALEPDALTCRLSLTNRAPDPMPAGLGLHPYFPRTPDMRLSARIATVQPISAEGLPTIDQPPPPEWDWTTSPVLRPFIDNPFTGWDGEARITWPSRGLGLDITTEPRLPHLVVYAPDGQDYACVEPMTHAIDAHNRGTAGDRLGLVELAPGEILAITVRFRPFAI